MSEPPPKETQAAMPPLPAETAEGTSWTCPVREQLVEFVNGKTDGWCGVFCLRCKTRRDANQ